MDSFKGVTVLFVPNKRPKKVGRPVNLPKYVKKIINYEAIKYKLQKCSIAICL
jgi:hypothetical protein